MEGIKRRRLSAEAWQELFRRHADGGEPIGTFCQREGVSTHSYRRWKLRLGEQTSAAACTPVPAGKSTQVGPMAAAPFVDLGALSTASPAEGRLELRLDLGGGMILHLVRG
ncbi:MAG TPA: transposase [Lysobacter sp.]|jgi:transposase-like protein|nr:transposase [Lysobacter sp.]